MRGLVRLFLLAAVVTACFATAVLAQSDGTRSSTDGAGSAANAQQQPGTAAVPPSRLEFKYSPAVVQQNAKAGKFLRIQIAPKPITFEYFNYLNRVSREKNRAGLYIGVVVDTQDDDWSSKKIRDVHQHLTNLMIGNRVLRKMGREEVVGLGDEGWSELFGAYVGGMFPIEYDPTDRRNAIVDDEMAGTDTPNYAGVPVEVGDILVAVNDHAFPFEKDGSYIDSLAELQVWLGDYLEESRHLYAVDEYLRHKDIIQRK